MTSLLTWSQSTCITIAQNLSIDCGSNAAINKVLKEELSTLFKCSFKCSFKAQDTFLPTFGHVHCNSLDVLAFDHTLHYNSLHCVEGKGSPCLQLLHSKTQIKQINIKYIKILLFCIVTHHWILDIQKYLSILLVCSLKRISPHNINKEFTL